MSESYAKLSSTLVHSTVWRESAETRVVWITLLALADQHGEVQASIPGLADAARVTLAECEAALKVFLAPDTYSRNKTLGGRRITEIPGGWFIVNYDLYRGLLNLDHRRALARDRQARHRSKERNAVTRDVTPRNEKSRQAVSSKQEAVSSKQKETTTTSSRKAATEKDGQFDEVWAIYPKRAGGNSKAAALKAWNARRREGVSSVELRDGVARYAAFCQATGKVGTEFVKQASTFFGPTGAWVEEWAAPGAIPKRVVDPSVTEAAKRTETAVRRREERYFAAMAEAGIVWARANPKEYEKVVRAVEASYHDKSGAFHLAAKEAELAQRCGRAAGFPSFEKWGSTTP